MSTISACGLHTALLGLNFFPSILEDRARCIGEDKSWRQERSLFLPLPNSLTFSYCGNKGQPIHLLFLYLEELDRYPCWCEREGLLVFLYLPFTGSPRRRNRTSARTSLPPLRTLLHRSQALMHTR